MNTTVDFLSPKVHDLGNELDQHIESLEAELAEARACRDRLGTVMNGHAKATVLKGVKDAPAAGSGPVLKGKRYVLLDKLPANKTFTVANAAAKLKCSKNYAYTLLKQLIDDFLVEKVDTRNYRRK